MDNSPENDRTSSIQTEDVQAVDSKAPLKIDQITNPIGQQQITQKHAGGRPTIYEPGYCERVNDFIELCKTEQRLPTQAGLGLYLKCSKRVINDWGKKYPEFLHSLEVMLNTQEDILINKGVSGVYNPTITKLMLMSNHGMSEKTDLTSGGRSLASPTMVVHEPPKQIESKIIDDKNVDSIECAEGIE